MLCVGTNLVAEGFRLLAVEEERAHLPCKHPARGDGCEGLDGEEDCEADDDEMHMAGAEDHPCTGNRVQPCEGGVGGRGYAGAL